MSFTNFLKFSFVSTFLIGFVISAPPPSSTIALPLEKADPEIIPILSQSEELKSNGTYTFRYETGNGIKREETAFDKVSPKVEGRSARNDDDDDSNDIHVQRGSYSYTAPDGTLISIRYVADENGFQPIGEHIPKVLSIETPPNKSNNNNASSSDNVTFNTFKVQKSIKILEPALLSRAADLNEEELSVKPALKLQVSSQGITAQVAHDSETYEKNPVTTDTPEITETSTTSDSVTTTEVDVQIYFTSVTENESTATESTEETTTTETQNSTTETVTTNVL